MKNEMQIDKKNIENLFMFKYIMLNFFFEKKTYLERKIIHAFLFENVLTYSNLKPSK
jgi:hypothetical protein